MKVGVCDGCGGLKRLNGAGKIPTHYIGIAVSARAVRSVGARREAPPAAAPLAVMVPAVVSGGPQ
jgi:hypothetical protein